MPESKAKTPLPKAGKLFWDFIKIGFFTFGGGWSIVAQIQQEFVEKEEWLTQEELLDIVSVGRSLPGIMIANISSIFGYHMAGPAGALACVFGITLPSLLVLTAVTFFYTFIRENPYVARALLGVRAAVVPIVFFAAAGLSKTALKDKLGYLIALGALVLSLFFGVSNVLIVFLGAAGGLIIMEVRERGAR